MSVERSPEGTSETTSPTPEELGGATPQLEGAASAEISESLQGETAEQSKVNKAPPEEASPAPAEAAGSGNDLPTPAIVNPAANAAATTAPAAGEAPAAPSSGPTAPKTAVGEPPALPLRESLVNFYAKHVPAKVNDVDTILERFAGKHDRLVSELEKKYSCRLADYAPGSKLAKELTGNKPKPNVTVRSPSVAAPTVAPPTSGTRSAAAPSVGPGSSDLVASLRAEVRTLRAQVDALRGDKAQGDAATATLRRDKKQLEDNVAALREQRRIQDRQIMATAAQEAAATERAAAVGQRCSELEGALAATTRRCSELEAALATSQEEAMQHLEAKTALRTQLHLALGSLGARVDPYSVAPPADAPHASGPLDDRSTELRVVLAAKAEAEGRAADQAAHIEQLGAALAGLQQAVEETSGSGESLKAEVEARDRQLREAAAAHGAAQAQLVQAAAARARDQAEIERLRGTLLIAAATRREMQARSERERGAVEAAARERLGEAAARLLLEREDAASEESELWALQRKAFEEEKELMKLEIDGLSRSILELRNERTMFDEEATALREELKRAAEMVLRHAPPGTVFEPRPPPV